MSTHLEIGALRRKIRQTQSMMLWDDEKSPQFTSYERSNLSYAILYLAYAEDQLALNYTFLAKRHYDKAQKLCAGIVDRTLRDSPRSVITFPHRRSPVS